jgi:indole-3-acetate monooxygenase
MAVGCRAIAGVRDDKADSTETLLARAWVHAAYTLIVERCFALAGAGAALSVSPLQRRLRDILVAEQHFMVSQRFDVRAGAQFLGFPPLNPIFER